MSLELTLGVGMAGMAEDNGSEYEQPVLTSIGSLVDLTQGPPTPGPLGWVGVGVDGLSIFIPL